MNSSTVLVGIMGKYADRPVGLYLKFCLNFALRLMCNKDWDKFELH